MRMFINLKFFDGVNTSNFPTQMRDFYDKVALRVALPLLVFRKWGQKRPLPRNKGKVIRFKRWGNLAPATTPLTEGITPAGNKLDYTELTATVEQYGDWIPVTDQVLMMSIDPELKEASEKLGIQEGQTMDILMRNSLVAGSNVQYAGGVTARSEVKEKITSTDLDIAIRTLTLAETSKITKQISPTTNYGTTPIRGSFIGVVSPYSSYDIQKIEGFVPVEKYPSNSGVMEGEIGAYKGIRFVETNNAMVFEDAGAVPAAGIKITSTKADVFPLLIFGEDAYGEVPLSGSNHGIIIKVHGKDDRSDTSDPLNQRGSAGWKNMWTAKILNDAWMLRLEHAVSA